MRIHMTGHCAGMIHRRYGNIHVRLVYAVLALLAALAISACRGGPAGSVSVEKPADGAKVTSPFIVQMAVSDLTVEPAGTVRDGYGHHHILVDTDLPAVGRPIPSDGQHRHFGKGQTEAVLDLPPGEHTLRLLFARGDHVPYDPAVTASVKVTVTERRAVTFLEPADGARVTSPFTVRMATESVTVEPAGTVRDGYGHHHILVDTDLSSTGQPVPSDNQHLHFGKGQTETTLNLPAGDHTLTLLFAGGDHVPNDPPISKTIRVTVLQ